MNGKKVVIVSDVDGVLTDGSFYYNENGKCMKKFGRDDADSLKILKQVAPDFEVHFCSSDFHGFEITTKRLSDMGYSVDKVSVKERPQWIKKNFPDCYVYYIGDSFVDVPVFKSVDYSCCVNNGHYLAKKNALYVSSLNGGDGGFADCILEILSKELSSTKESLMLNYVR